METLHLQNTIALPEGPNKSQEDRPVPYHIVDGPKFVQKHTNGYHQTNLCLYTRPADIEPCTEFVRALKRNTLALKRDVVEHYSKWAKGEYLYLNRGLVATLTLQLHKPLQRALFEQIGFPNLTHFKALLSDITLRDLNLVDLATQLGGLQRLKLIDLSGTVESGPHAGRPWQLFDLFIEHFQQASSTRAPVSGPSAVNTGRGITNRILMNSVHKVGLCQLHFAINEMGHGETKTYEVDSKLPSRSLVAIAELQPHRTPRIVLTHLTSTKWEANHGYTLPHLMQDKIDDSDACLSKLMSEATLDSENARVEINVAPWSTGLITAFGTLQNKWLSTVQNRRIGSAVRRCNLKLSFWEDQAKVYPFYFMNMTNEAGQHGVRSLGAIVFRCELKTRAFKFPWLDYRQVQCLLDPAVWRTVAKQHAVNMQILFDLFPPDRVVNVLEAQALKSWSKFPVDTTNYHVDYRIASGLAPHTIRHAPVSISRNPRAIFSTLRHLKECKHNAQNARNARASSFQHPVVPQ